MLFYFKARVLNEIAATTKDFSIRYMMSIFMLIFLNKKSMYILLYTSKTFQTFLFLNTVCNTHTLKTFIEIMRKNKDCLFLRKITQQKIRHE